MKQPKDYSEAEGEEDPFAWEYDNKEDNILIVYLVMLLVAVIGYGLYWVVDAALP